MVDLWILDSTVVWNGTREMRESLGSTFTLLRYVFHLISSLAILTVHVVDACTLRTEADKNETTISKSFRGKTTSLFWWFLNPRFNYKGARQIRLLLNVILLSFITSQLSQSKLKERHFKAVRKICTKYANGFVSFESNISFPFLPRHIPLIILSYFNLK